jgi:hypothetical protein
MRASCNAQQSIQAMILILRVIFCFEAYFETRFTMDVFSTGHIHFLFQKKKQEVLDCFIITLELSAKRIIRSLVYTTIFLCPEKPKRLVLVFRRPFDP